MKKNKGFTLLIAIITTSMLLIVSFVVVNIALKQLILASAAKESQYAFYAADSGTECAVYWDLPKDGSISKFDVTTPGVIDGCNEVDYITNKNIHTGSQTIPEPSNPSSVIGGNATSIFWLQFTKGCAIVRVTKADGLTTIDSRGYNTCDMSASRRYERGVKLVY
jgi:hypothetical protein